MTAAAPDAGVSFSHAFLGLGGMGSGMACNLLDNGLPLVVYNRSPHKAADAVAAGAQLADSAAAAVANADIVVVSLADERAQEEVVFTDAVTGLRPGAYLVDTSTVSPTYSREATARLAAHGVTRVEACVVGNPMQAREGALRIFAAGPDKHVAAVQDVLQVLGHQVIHVGDTGAGATMKLVFNLLLGAQVSSLAEGVAFGVESGLDRTLLLDTIRQSGFSSLVMGFRAEIMRDRRYEPAAFRSTLMAKDLRFALREAERVGVALPVTASASGQFDNVVAEGGADRDAAVIVEHVPRRAAR